MSHATHPAINTQVANEIRAHAHTIQCALNGREVNPQLLEQAFERLPQLVAMAQLRLRREVTP